MATVAPDSPAKAGPIPVRTIGDDDLRWSLRQGWEDFRDLRGDLVFAGLIYTLIGLAAVVMTTSRPLIPFFYPVVAGVALLGPIAAVGFYELARRRESGQEVHWFNFLDVRKRPTLDDMGIVAGLLLVIFVGWLVAAGASLCPAVRVGDPDVDRRLPLGSVHDAAWVGAHPRRGDRRRDLRLDRARAQRRVPADAGRL